MLEKNQICMNVEEFLQARVVTFLNPYSLLKISESGIDLHKFDKICIDGIALKIFLEKIYRGSEIQRLSFDFTSIAHLVFENAATKNEKGFILGSDENSNNQFISSIESSFSGIKLDGRSGYFENEQDSADTIETLSSSSYDFIVIGMGAVKQEQIAGELVDHGFQGRIYTCGGFIHQTAMSGGEYYPAWIDKFNLRFAYRMFKEPSTIARYLIDYPKAFYLMTRNRQDFKY